MPAGRRNASAISGKIIGKAKCDFFIAVSPSAEVFDCDTGDASPLPMRQLQVIDIKIP
jgi:hypothetical protein